MGTLVAAAIPAIFSAASSAIGPLVASAGTAAGAAGASTTAGTLATALQAGGQLFAGVGALQEGMYASELGHRNADVARVAGQREEEAKKLETGRLVASQEAAQAANGIDVGSGSAVAVRNATAAIGSLDAAMIHYNAMRKSLELNTQADLDSRAGKFGLFKGVLGAGNTILSGAQSNASKWDAFKREGAVSG